MQISTFWKALDELTDGGASRHHWAQFLGREWKAVAPFLKPTGSLARTIDCPSPGGEGCPRQVVRHRDDSVRAVCRDTPKACKDLDLSMDDLGILELDRRALGEALAAALSLTRPAKPVAIASVMRIGTRDIHAGSGVPVFLVVPGAVPNMAREDLCDVLNLSPPVLVLTPSPTSLPEEMTSLLDLKGVTILGLDDLVIAASPRRFALTAQGTAQMDGLLQRLQDSTQGSAGPNRAWALPPDARWEEITIRFIADEVVNVTFRGETRRFEPDGLGMKSAKNGRPKAIWTYLKAFGLNGGRLSVHRGDPTETSKHQKQKQVLSRALRDAFGIADEPIPTEEGDYVTWFVVSADDLQQGKQGPSRRNSVGSD